MSINLNPVYVIIAINCLVSFYCFNRPGLFDRLKFQVSAISNGQYYRIVSSGFLHVDFTHLLFNMITLFFFGDVVVSAFGVNAFHLIYFFCLILRDELLNINILFSLGGPTQDAQQGERLKSWF